MMKRAKTLLVASLVVFAVISYFSDQINPYYLDIITGIGINIILAVSLNLINGYTGQFSLGHAGFMAVGAYVAGMLTTTFGAALLPALAGQQWLLFMLALLAGGIGAAAAGFVVGMPSLRLKGDYLAIVTLGFGEIIRVVLNNIDAVGGPRGMIGVPAYTSLFWAFGLAAITTYVVW